MSELTNFVADATRAGFVNRIRMEKVELDEKIVKLTQFIASDKAWLDISSHDRDLLFKQQYVMLQYSLILGDRLVSLGEF